MLIDTEKLKEAILAHGAMEEDHAGIEAERKSAAQRTTAEYNRVLNLENLWYFYTQESQTNADQGRNQPDHSQSLQDRTP